MTAGNVYYFDVLPLHPQPEPLETLTSYLTRLATANQLRSMTQLLNLCFPNERSRLTISNRDFPPVSFGALPVISQCSRARLLATTFCHIGQKFDRPPKPRALISFLSGVLARQLRYCPLCLAEYGYYRLTWRFLAVAGCVEHRCRLLDGCGHCGQPLPFLSYTPQLGGCPACGGDLRTCATTQLDEPQLEIVQDYTQDFEYLLEPQRYETQTEGMPLIRLIGQRLTHWRQVRGLTLAEVARQLNQYPPLFSYLENGNHTRGLGIQRYLIYANLLRLSLRDLFERPVPGPPPTQNYEDEVLQKVQQAIIVLEQQGQSVTQTKVKQMTGVGMPSFIKYPKVKAFWAEYKAKLRQKWEAEMIQHVHHAAITLKQQGHRLTKTAISRLVGQNPNNLRFYYPTIWAVVADYSESQAMVRSQAAKRQNSDNQKRPYRREPELVHKVEQAIEQLQRQGKLISQYAIADLVGMSTDGLIYYPRVRAILHANKGEHQGQDETVLLERVQAAVAHLEATDARVSREAVARLVGLSSCTFNYYPRVKTFLTEQVTKYQECRSRQRQQLEEELELKVHQAIALLTINGSPVTQKAISEILDMSVKRLHQFPRVKSLLQQTPRPDYPN